MLKIWQDKQDRKHKLQILDRQMDQMRLGHNQRLEEVTVNAESSTRSEPEWREAGCVAQCIAMLKHDGQLSGIKWVDGLRDSVRPVIIKGDVKGDGEI